MWKLVDYSDLRNAGLVCSRTHQNECWSEGEGGLGGDGVVRMRALMVGVEEAMVSSFVGVLDE